MFKGAARGNENLGMEALSVRKLSRKYPGIIKILKEMGVPLHDNDSLSLGYLCEEAGVDPDDIFARLENKDGCRQAETVQIESLTIIPGKDKNRKTEYPEPVTIRKGEIVALAGPTGSGKSQLLSDIEGLVQGDSPSGRIILLNEKAVDDSLRINQVNKPIAQISQTMNYILDLTVEEFLDIHIESRNAKNTGSLKKEIVKAACSLCGESFHLKYKMSSLSGGQARSLMIVDAITVSRSPVILVDEIENAGIRREQAIELLLSNSLITIIATHDPLIALLANRRIILKNGGMNKILVKSEAETGTLDYLRKMEEKRNQFKEDLRSGKVLRT